MGVLLGLAILQGNRFEALLNGDRIFPAMLAAIRDAKKTITFESHIYWSDPISRAGSAMQAWQQRPLAEKALEHAASLIGAQL